MSMKSGCKQLNRSVEGGSCSSPIWEELNVQLPLISVITVTFNAVEPLRATVESVKSQDLSGVEYIIIDGGSNDGTVEYLHSLGPELAYWISEPDNGIYDAMNKGLSIAKGRYVHFLNAGDTLINADILSQVASHLRKSPTILMTRVRAVHDGGVKIFPMNSGLKRVREVFKSAYCHQGAFVRKKSYLDIDGFDLSYRHFADFKALWLIREEQSCQLIEIPLESVVFPLDGVSSDWRHAPALAAECERLMAELNDPVPLWRYMLTIIRAHLYRLKMAIYEKKKSTPFTWR